MKTDVSKVWVDDKYVHILTCDGVERMEAIEELYTILADKQLEFYLMSVIPMVMIMYLRIGAGPMIKSLYGNLTGILTMSVCLVIYGGSYLYGKKILEIDG